ncbi:FitA-like ribbon-helix-helix domain-containing protein [Subtercola endophyticus]|uniref:FitA-like ribbon-helix-helix domain-containing protein n=1 Tax=Subtercola endophyticus TaxID=2895559 RepID=UPI001E449A75|nr:hypothetical protein [Subtercola endophyticus]UFS60396.1 hypothetical protein LQ955_06525 [Subtercola endophyticus]
MATLTVRNLEATMIEKLKARATQNGRSMEAEARAILAKEFAPPHESGAAFVERIRQRFTDVDTSDLNFDRDPDQGRPVRYEQ